MGVKPSKTMNLLIKRHVSAVNLGELILDEGPVDDLPPVFNVFSATILVITVVSVFPEIENEEGGDTRHGEGRVAIVSVDDLPLAIVIDQPCVSAALEGHGELKETLLEFGEAVEVNAETVH